ncbi:Protein F33H12.6 [Aphelenchoides avenae]|nr:Protein F33H12.6 [Aphelenchus avenae]
MFAFMERDRMNFYRLHQNELKADGYNLQHFLEGLEFDGDPTIGKAIILPATYPGSPRYWTNQFEDAMAIVRYYGRPDIFLIMTFTLDNGEEFEECSTDRPDIIARVFDTKKDALMAELREERCFGELVAWIFVIEFQKRGLPHLHAILTLKAAD